MKKLLLLAAAGVLLAVIPFPSYAAEQGRAGLASDIATDLADSSAITAAELRGIMTDLVDSNFNLTDNAITDITDVTATATEVNYLDITTLGTGAASKAVVLDASGDYTYPSTGTIVYPASSTLTLNASSVFSLYGTAVTATGAELNYSDITTLGTGAASKAVVLDAGEDYTWPATGILTYGVLKDPAGTTLTSTVAELNYLDLTTLGTGAASKALVLDAGDDYVWPVTGILTYGVLKDPAGTALSATTAELNYNDIATLGTLAASKAWTSDANLDTVMPTGGKLTVQSGGEIVIPTGAILTVDTVAVNHNALALPGRATIMICGDADTVNNNTVYYGPSQTVGAAGDRSCDPTAAGNVTEATADLPAFTDTAFQVLSWYCLQPDANADLTYTLRSAEAALTPANAITIANNALSGSSTTASTTAIASGATFAIAVSSTSDVGTAQFSCAVNVAY